MNASSELNLEHRLLTVHVPGDLISTNADAIRREISPALTPTDGSSVRWQTLKLDLTASKVVDSVGLNLIVFIFKAVSKAGGRMQVAYSNPNVHRTLLFTRLDRHVDLIKV